MSRDIELYIEDIKNACSRILKYTHSLNFEEFCEDEKTYDAVLRNIQIIGDAAKKLPDKMSAQIQNVEWSKVKGLRDIVVHEYFGLDIDIIWDIVQTKIPHLLTALQLYKSNSGE